MTRRAIAFGLMLALFLVIGGLDTLHSYYQLLALGFNVPMHVLEAVSRFGIVGLIFLFFLVWLLPSPERGKALQIGFLGGFLLCIVPLGAGKDLDAIPPYLDDFLSGALHSLGAMVLQVIHKGSAAALMYGVYYLFIVRWDLSKRRI